MRRRVLLFIALFGSFALSQDTPPVAGAQLPLATAGTVLRWAPDGDEVVFDLPASARVKLSVYSPGIDLNEVGDEVYVVAPLEASFTLSGPDGVVATKRFGSASSDWFTFYEGSAAAGRYSLQSHLNGDGKNVYLLRLETELSDISLKAASVTVNASSEAWTDAFSFDIVGHESCALSLYDGDGDAELAARLRLPSGTLQPVTRQLVVSGDRRSVTQALPRLPGRYTVQLALPAGRYQRTNAVRLTLLCDGAAQLVTLAPTAPLELVALPVALPTPVVSVAPKRPLPLPTPDATVTPKRPLELPQVRAELLPRPELVFTRALSADSLAPCHALTVALTVSNSGDAAGTYLLREALPEGLRLVAQEGAAVSGNDLVWQGDLGPGAAVTLAYSAELAPAAPPLLTLRGLLAPTLTETSSETVVLEDTVTRADLTTELTAPEGPLYVGDETAVKLTLRNPLPEPVTVSLDVQPSGRLETVEAPETLTVPAQGSADTTLSVRAVEEGTGLLEVTPYCGSEDSPAGAAGLLQLVAQALPELPQPRQTTTVVVDVAAYDLPGLTGLVLLERLPEGASYVAGSAKVNGRAADPRAVADAILFDLPGEAVGQVSFTVLHEGPLDLGADHGSLIGLSPEPEVLVGAEEVLELYRKAKLPPEASNPEASNPEALNEAFDTNVVARERVGAVILAPAPGTVSRERDRVTVSVDTPLSSDVTLTVNGERVAAETVGKRVSDPNLNRQTYDYVGVPLQPGPNELRLRSVLDGETFGDGVTVYFSGPAAGFALLPLAPLVADAATPLELDLALRDAWGNAPLDGFVTLEVEGARLLDDASSEEPGQQVRTVNGHARLALEPLTEPGEVTVRVWVGEAFQSATLSVTSDLRPWIVSGVGSVGAAYGEDLTFGAGGSFFARGRVFDDYLLTLAARYPFADLGPTDSNPYQTFPVPGSSGAASYGAESRQGVYARLERGFSYLQYGDFTTPLVGDFLDFGRFYTGLSGVYARGGEVGGFGVRAYAAYEGVSDQRTVDLKSDGTSLRFVPDAPLEPSTLRVTVIKKDASGLRVEDDFDPVTRELTPLLDFRIDEETGVLELFKPVPLTDDQNRPYYLRLSYTLAEGNVGRYLQVGAQAETTLSGVVFRAGVAQETSSGATFNRVVAAGASYDGNGLSADAEVAYGVNAEAGGVAVSTRLLYTADALSAEARWRYVSAGYRSPVVTTASAGHTLDASVSYGFSAAFGVAAKTTLRAEAGALNVTGDALGLYQDRGFDVQFGVNFDDGLLRPLVGGNLYDLFGWRGSRLGVVHRQGLGAGAQSVTQFGAAFPLLSGLSLTVSDELVWGVGNALLLGLEATLEHDRIRASLCRTVDCEREPGTLGSTTVTAQYELPGGVGAAAGRVRLGVDTTLPVSEALSLQFGAEYRRSLGDSSTEAALRAGASYDAENLDASLRYEVSWNPTAVKHVVFGGSTFALSERLYGSVTGTYLSDSAQGAGLSFSVAGAYRGERVSLLTNNTAQFGALAREEGGVWGDTRVTWALSDRYDLRFGYAYRYAGTGYLDLVNVGGSFDAWRGGNLLAQARLFDDWSADERAFGVGLEVSQRLGCGVYAVAGYNLGGLDRDYGPVYGGSGFFVRFDAVFDEQWSCGHAVPAEGGN